MAIDVECMDGMAVLGDNPVDPVNGSFACDQMEDVSGIRGRQPRGCNVSFEGPRIRTLLASTENLCGHFGIM